jgi:hypothetical protein
MAARAGGKLSASSWSYPMANQAGGKRPRIANNAVQPRKQGKSRWDGRKLPRQSLPL